MSEAARHALRSTRATRAGFNPVTKPVDERRVEIEAGTALGSATLDVHAVYDLELTIGTDTLGYGNSTVLRVQATDEAGNYVALAGDVPLAFSLDGSAFGRLTWGGSVGPLLAGVPYGEAAAWQVGFTADGVRPEGVAGVTVLVEAPNGAEASATLFIDNGGLLWERFLQADPRWADELIDHRDDLTMGSDGCAVTALAMVLKAAGIDTDPKRLNDRMKEHGGWNHDRGNKSFNNKGWVIWDAVNKQGLLPDEKHGIIINKGYERSPTFDRVNQLIDAGYIVLMEVGSFQGIPRQHWVVVTGRTGETYTILDPADRSGPLEEVTGTLADYDDSPPDRITWYLHSPK